MGKRGVKPAPFYERYDLHENGCWIWNRGGTMNGYGQIKVDGKQTLAHRRSWELHIGPIPEGAWILHKCDVRACVNPEHLFLGNQQTNMDDMVAKGRSASKESGTWNAGRTRKFQDGDLAWIRKFYQENKAYGISNALKQVIAKRFDCSITTVESAIRGTKTYR